MKHLRETYEVVQKSNRLFEVSVLREHFWESFIHVTTQTEFDTLSQIACTDWIEEGYFLLTYILTNQMRNQNLMFKVTIGREDESMPSVLKCFPQAEVMERDLHEMYGIGFEGNETLYDFALEQWNDVPPLRREFDTLAFVHEHFAFKGGRDDNKDVKVEQKRRREEAKKRKAQQAAEQEATKPKETQAVTPAVEEDKEEIGTKPSTEEVGDGH